MTRRDDPRLDLLAGLHGRVIEIGAGAGATFGLYPASVEHLLAIEPDPARVRLARLAARQAPIPVEVVEGFGSSLPVETGSADAVVLSLVLCSVADVPATLVELERVLRPGGALRFYEHVLADDGSRRRMQNAIAPLWQQLSGGCDPARESLAAIGDAGFELLGCERIERANGPLGMRVPHVLGSARSRRSKRGVSRPRGRPGSAAGARRPAPPSRGLSPRRG